MDVKRNLLMVFVLGTVCFAGNKFDSLYYGVGIGAGFNKSNIYSTNSVYDNMSFTILVKDNTSAQIHGFIGSYFDTFHGNKAAVQIEGSYNNIANTLYQATPTNIVQLETKYNYGASIRLYRKLNTKLSTFLVGGGRITKLATLFTTYSTTGTVASNSSMLLFGPEIGIGSDYCYNANLDYRFEYKYFFGGKSDPITSAWSAISYPIYVTDTINIHQHSLQFSVVM